MTHASLFVKLQEHEIKLGKLEKHENQENKSKGIALKVDTKEEKEEDAPEEKERKFSRKRMLPLQQKMSLAMNLENKET